MLALTFLFTTLSEHHCFLKSCPFSAKSLHFYADFFTLFFSYLFWLTLWWILPHPPLIPSLIVIINISHCSRRVKGIDNKTQMLGSTFGMFFFCFFFLLNYMPISEVKRKLSCRFLIGLFWNTAISLIWTNTYYNGPHDCVVCRSHFHIHTLLLLYRTVLNNGSCAEKIIRFPPVE